MLSLYSILNYIQHYCYNYLYKKELLEELQTKIQIAKQTKKPQKTTTLTSQTHPCWGHLTLLPATGYVQTNFWVHTSLDAKSDLYCLAHVFSPSKRKACTKSMVRHTSSCVHLTKGSKDLSQSTIKWVWMPYLRHPIVFINFDFKLLLDIIK